MRPVQILLLLLITWRSEGKPSLLPSENSEESEEPVNDNPSYSYMYTVQDTEEQNYQMHEEEMENDEVKGQYSWVAPDGTKYTVVYTAGKDGYNAEVKKEPGAVIMKPKHKQMVILAPVKQVIVPPTAAPAPPPPPPTTPAPIPEVDNLIEDVPYQYIPYNPQYRPTIVRVPVGAYPQYNNVRPTLVRVPEKTRQAAAVVPSNGFNQVIYRSPVYSYDYRTPSLSSLYDTQ